MTIKQLSIFIENKGGTNTIQSHWENHTERGDYAFFDKTYASNKINCAKPNPHFFELILEAENYKPEETFLLMINKTILMQQNPWE